jgi:hypothetical protein
MGISSIQIASGSNSTATSSPVTFTVTMPSTPVAACIVVNVGAEVEHSPSSGLSVTSIAVSDNKGNTYIPASFLFSGTYATGGGPSYYCGAGQMFYCLNAIAGVNTITISVSGTNWVATSGLNLFYASASVWSGVLTANQPDGTSQNDLSLGPGHFISNPGSITTTLNGDLIVLASMGSCQQATPTGFSVISASAGGPLFDYYMIQSSAGTINPTSTNGVSAAGVMAQFALKAIPNDFTISASPALKTVQPTGSSTYTVTIANGSDNVTLSLISGLPAGATASFSPNPVVNGSGTSILTVTATNVAAGTYVLTIQGQDATATFIHTTTVRLQVLGSFSPRWVSR